MALLDPAGQYINRKNTTIVRRAPEVRNNKKSKIIPPLERIGHLELLSIYRLPWATNQQFFSLAKSRGPQRNLTFSILRER